MNLTGLQVSLENELLREPLRSYSSLVENPLGTRFSGSVDFSDNKKLGISGEQNLRNANLMISHKVPLPN